MAIVVRTVVTGLSYPSVREAGQGLEQFMESMPEGMMEMMGVADGLTSPHGYLNSQLYSNVFPIVLLIFGIALLGTWSVAGSERDGTLESLWANPVHRWRVAVERYVGTALLLAALSLLATVLLIAFRATFELDALSVNVLVAAGVATWLLALLFFIGVGVWPVGVRNDRRGLSDIQKRFEAPGCHSDPADVWRGGFRQSAAPGCPRCRELEPGGRDPDNVPSD